MKLIHLLLETEVRSVLSVMGQQPDEMEKFSCGSFNDNVDGHNFNIESLYGVPKRVRNAFVCSNNRNLRSLEHCPAPVTAEGYILNCHNCVLTSLKHAPNVVQSFNCSNNPLTSLEGAPSIINSDLICDLNYLTSLKSIHHHIKSIKRNASFINYYKAPHLITSHVLGLMKIEGLKCVKFNNRDVCTIINDHLEGNVNGSNLEACADALCEAGFEEYAQL